VIARPCALLRRHRTFVKDVATLITGKGASFLITFLSTPILSRLYEPQHFGVGALYLSLITIAATLATLSWERAAVVAKNDAEATRLCHLGLYSLSAGCVLLWLTGLCALALSLPVPFAEELGIWVWTLPAGLFLLGVSQIGDGWLTRTKDFKTIALSDFALTVTVAGSRIASGAAMGSTAFGMVAGFLMGKFAEIAILFRGIRPWASNLRATDQSLTLRRVAAAYRDFPLYSASNSFVRMFSQELPTVVFAALYSPAVVGYYAMASRLVRLPLRFAATALQPVFLQRLAEIENAGRPLSSAYTKLTVALATVALPVFAAMWLWGDIILTTFLGPKWEQAGHYVVILVPWLYSIWIAGPAATVLTVLRRQALLLHVQLLLTVVRIAIFALAHLMDASAEATLQAFVAVSALSSFGSVLATYVVTRRADRAKAVAGAA
jgi:lipopolysaccharide exporter